MATKPNGAKDQKKIENGAEVKQDKGQRSANRVPRTVDSPFHQIMPILLTALTALTGVCIYAPGAEMGVFGKIIHDACFGLLGGGAYLIPAMLLLTAIFWRDNVRKGMLARRLIFAVALIFIVSVFSYTFGTPLASMRKVGRFFVLGTQGVGGGLFGGLVGCLFYLILSKIGSFIVFATALIIVFVYAYGGAAKVWGQNASVFLRDKLAAMKERRAEEKAARAALEAHKHNERAFDESVFSSAPTANRSRTEQGQPEASNLSVYDTAEKPVTRRHFYDMDAETSEPKATVNTAPQRSFTRDTVAVPKSETPTASAPRGDNAIAEEAEFRIVSSRPIPPNRATPFSAAGAQEQRAQAVQTSAENPVSASSVGAEKTAEPVAAPVPEEGGASLAAEQKSGEEASTLVINKAHVVEHIGAETLASAEDIQKKDETFFYSFPPLSLLHEDDAFNQEDSDLEIEAKADKLRETLQNFGVAADITCVSRGPRLTRYELVPRPGVRISKVENLVDEITMNLEAISVRIEAPIPGKAAIGVEVPNINTTTVRLRGLLDTDTFRDAPGKTTVCLGVDVVGKPVFADLDKMPHLLVAGATGMGKSVCINSLLISLLYKARPDEVKLILIDPKKVEFQSYANIPHLLVPVVTEPQKAAGALAWAVGEMERRYDLIESAAVRNIVAYNKTVDDHPGRVKMPQIVVVIDELHDLMLQARDAVEDSIARIAAKARAAGILLIIGTQRPSVNVITGVIKANIPSRIAFHVASQVDSRTILDAVGAEKLLNNGDMLFLSPGMKMMTPKRVQGAFLDDDEVNRVADYLRKNSSAVIYDEAVMADMERESEKCNKDKKQGSDFGAVENGADMAEDELFYKAVEVALESGKISTSLLQRRLSLGFGKAARLIDRMEDMNIVSPPNGQKPREVLITVDEYRAMRLRGDE